MSVSASIRCIPAPICEGNAFVVTVTEVCGMTSKLKINKSDGLTGSSSDHFVYAPHRFAVLFTMLINVMLVHGCMPDDMLASVLVPIPKDPRASLTNSGNYRAIALYSSMGKIVDMLISDRYSNQLMTSNAQFAFKKLGVRSLANASRARQFNPLNPPGVGWVPLPQTNMAAVVGRARSCAVVRGRSCAVVRAWSVIRGRAWSCAVGRAWSCAVGRAWSCVVVPFCPLRGQHGSQHCRAARFAASTAVTRTNEGRNEQHIITP